MAATVLYIVHEGKEYYLEWSSIVDAPVTNGLSQEEFTEWFKMRHGPQWAEDLPERIALAKQKGTSSRTYASFDEQIAFNRAGPREECLTKQGIIKKYILDQPLDPSDIREVKDQ